MHKHIMLVKLFCQHAILLVVGSNVNGIIHFQFCLHHILLVSVAVEYIHSEYV